MKPEYLIFIAVGYLIGSIPSALIIGKQFYHTDVRQYGSGNLGGSNAGRVLGKKVGAIVIVLDVLKAVIPVLITTLVWDENCAILLGLAAAVGHCYPLFANFKGGKAVATSFGFIGAISVIQPWHFLWLLIVPLVILFLVTKLTKYVSVGSMTSFAASMIASFFVQENTFLSVSLVLLWLFIVYRHRGNIKKLRNHTESKVSW